MYAGLTIANKPALLDAKARGAEWVARDASGIVCGYKTKPVKVERDREWYTDDGFVLDMHKGMKFVKWGDPDPVNIDLALAQIADMEAAQNPAAVIPVSEKPLTWNERINQMTVEEKVFWLNCTDFCRVSEIPIENCNSFKDCKECIRAFLNSPYTEGDTDEG